MPPGDDANTSDTSARALKEALDAQRGEYADELRYRRKVAWAATFTLGFVGLVAGLWIVWLTHKKGVLEKENALLQERLKQERQQTCTAAE